MANCLERTNAQFLSEAGAEAVSACILEGACDASGKDISDCAEARIKPTGASIAFCREHIRASFDCGYSPSRELCEHDFAFSSDGELERLRTCDAEPDCAKRAACQQGGTSS